jgi:hypothetical protein
MLIVVQVSHTSNVVPSSPCRTPLSDSYKELPHPPHKCTVLLFGVSDSRARVQSLENLSSLYILLTAHPNTLPGLLNATHQRTINAALAKCLVNPDQLIKFLTIACLARIAQQDINDESQDQPQSLFEGTKGAKVIKLAISTVLSAVATPIGSSAEVLRLCGVALEAIDPALVGEWIQQRGSGQQVTRLRERAEGAMEGEMFQAV